MKKIKVMVVFGTRPEAIKMAPIIKELKNKDNIECIVCVTAQHREMLDQVIEIFNIDVDYDLDIMKKNQTIADITNKALSGLYDVIKKEAPNIVLVHGDTTTTFVAALASFYNKVDVGHVEAGLRSHNIYSPYPEEMNRKITSNIASIHFAPTINSKNNLISEGVSSENVFITGNTVIDALFEVVKDNYKFKNDYLNNLDFENKKIVLLTTHRRENLGKPMENIFKAINKLVDKNPDIEIIFPMHLNPLIRESASKNLTSNEKVHLIEPLEYDDFANVINKCYLILTDSGGIQEEAPSLGKPVIVLRTETERPEAIECGTAIIAGVDKDKIYNIANELINDNEKYDFMASVINPYGNGQSAKKIVREILNKYERE